jgi:putative hemolysin
MTDVLANIGLALLFVMIGGVFAAAEMALVSLREGQVKSLAQKGKRGARVARLAGDPNLFLSAVQIGVTLSGFLASAFAGATLAEDLGPVLAELGVPGPNTVALVLITIMVSYVSIVLGELAAKRLALQNAEAFAVGLGPLVDRVAKVSRPVIWFLAKSTNIVVRLLGGDPRADREQMSEEELRELVTGHETLGETERAIVEDVFEAGERHLREVMLPRTDVDFLDANTPIHRTVKLVTERPHSRYPVARGSADDVVGYVHVRDLLNPEIAGRGARVGDLVRDVLYLPGTKRVLAALSEMRSAGHHLAIVLDEYGGTAGIVTLEDLVEELVGDIRDEYDAEDDASARRLISGEVEVDGRINLGDFSDEAGFELPDGPYETVAGFVIAQLGHLPLAGETVELDGNRFTVTELDGRRVSKVRFTPAGGGGEQSEAAAEATPAEDDAEVEQLPDDPEAMASPAQLDAGTAVLEQARSRDQDQKGDPEPDQQPTHDEPRRRPDRSRARGRDRNGGKERAREQEPAKHD